MAFQPVLDTCEYRLHFQRAGVAHDIECVLHFRRNDGFTTAELTSGCEAGFAAFAGLLDGYCSSNDSLETITARVLTEEFGEFSEVTDSTPGTDAGAWASLNNAVLVRFLCGETGPPRKGGLFWPFVREDAVSGTGELTGISLDLPGLVQDFVDEVRANFGSGEAQHVVVSRNSKQAWIDDHPGATPAEIAAAAPWPRAEGITGTVTAYQLRQPVASQRDRRGS